MQSRTGSAWARTRAGTPTSGWPMPVPDDGEDGDFALTRSAYEGAGGMARGDDLVRVLEQSGRGSLAGLARKIVAGEIFGIEWRKAFWIPMFQFTEELLPKPGLKAVLAELASEYDGRRLADWFVEPNGWLEEARPIDVLDSNPAEVLQAARADRFVATG
jgi:hypothetical protein